MQLVGKLGNFTFIFPEPYTTLAMSVYFLWQLFWVCSGKNADFLAQGIKMYSLFALLQIQI